MYSVVWIQNNHLTNKVFVHILASCNNASLCSVSGAARLDRLQPSLKKFKAKDSAKRINSP